MAYFGVDGFSSPVAPGVARSGGRIASATAAGGSYGSGSGLAGSKAPYSSGGSTLQTAPVTASVFPSPLVRWVFIQGVTLSEGEEALLLD